MQVSSLQKIISSQFDKHSISASVTSPQGYQTQLRVISLATQTKLTTQDYIITEHASDWLIEPRAGYALNVGDVLNVQNVNYRIDSLDAEQYLNTVLIYKAKTVLT